MGCCACKKRKKNKSINSDNSNNNIKTYEKVIEFKNNNEINNSLPHNSNNYSIYSCQTSSSNSALENKIDEDNNIKKDKKKIFKSVIVYGTKEEKSDTYKSKDSLNRNKAFTDVKNKKDEKTKINIELFKKKSSKKKKKKNNKKKD